MTKTVIDQLRDAGMDIISDAELVFGELKRCKTDDDKGAKKSGWYVLHEVTVRGEAVVVGRFGNWKRYGGQSLEIDAELPVLSDDEKREFARQQQALRDQVAKEKAERAAEAASRAHRIWQNLPDSGPSPYLDLKKVRAYGLRFSRGSVVVPVRNARADLVGLQFIAPDGDKKFLTGTPKSGCWHLIGELDDLAKVLWIAEGYATAASVHMATGQPCVVAFDAGNLKPVALALRALYPDYSLLFAADNDCETDGNPGVTKAREAALAVGGRVWIPKWPVAA